MSRTVVIILAIVVGIIVLGIGSCAGFLYVGFTQADKIVSPRVEALFAAMENDAFGDTYDSELAPEFREVTTREQYEAIGNAITARLGALQSKSVRSFNMQQFNADKFIDVVYEAQFEKGKGTILAKLKMDRGKWKFLSFRVNSPVFEQDLVTEKCPECGEPHAARAKFCPSCGAKLVDETPNEQAAGEQSDPESSESSAAVEVP